eukprot:COSAG01_NODE_1276_length_10938_cov_76.499862_4_plen_30_part_00
MLAKRVHGIAESIVSIELIHQRLPDVAIR